MRPSRLLLSFLAIVGSLDTGFSFAHANKAPFSLSPTSREAPFLTRSNGMVAGVRQRKKTPAKESSVLRVSGGADNIGKDKDPTYKQLSVFLASLWGSGGVIYILLKAIKRVVPIALEPFSDGAVPLSQVQLG